MSERNVITQIGSLPFEDIKEAVSYSLKHDIPFLPELPKRGDAMLEYIKNPGRLSCLEEFKKNTFKTVKIQCVGPSTLIMSGYAEDEAIERMYNHISAIIDGLKAEKILLFLDEPALGQAGFDYKKAWEALFASFTVVPGVHVCGNMDWDELFDSNIEIISFDASQFDIVKYSKYRSGKRVAWGVRTREDIKDFKQGDLITLPCGMGSPIYKKGDCGKELDKLQGIAQTITTEVRND
jgi:hypothetical protein